MIYSVQQMGLFSLNKNCSKVQPGKMQPFVRQPFLPAFLFFSVYSWERYSRLSSDFNPIFLY